MNLPTGWSRTTVGAVAAVDSGPAFKSKDFGGPGQGTRLLRGDNIEPGRLRWERLRTWPDSLLAPYKHLLVEENDIILAMDRPVVSAGLKLARVRQQDLPALLVQRVARIRPTADVHTTFLYRLMETDEFTRHLLGNQVGTQLPHITLQSIRQFEFALPPVEEQRRIVEILEDHLSRLDAGAKLTNAAIRRLAAMERSVLARVAQTDALPQPLSDVAEIQGGIQKQPKRKPASNAYPFLRVANVTANGLDLTDVHQIELFGNELDRLRLERGDLLVVEGNGSPSQIGRAALWDGSIPNCVHQNHLIRVRPKKNLLPEFLEAVWNSPRNREELTRVASSTSGLYTLSVSKISSLPIPLPPIEEQRRRVAHVARVRDDRQRLEVEARAVLARSARLRRAVLAAAFSGRLTERTNTVGEELVGG